MTGQQRRWDSLAGLVLLVAGLLWTTAAGLAAGRYTPSWFDPDDPLPCETAPGGCGPDGPAAALQDLWWWAGVGGLVVLAGVALTVRSLDGAPRDTSRRTISPLGHALGAACLSPLVLVVLGPVGLFLLLVGGSAHVLVAVLLVGWLLESTGLAWLDGVIGTAGTSSRGRATVALAASAVAVGVTAVDLARSGGQPDAAVLVRHGTAVALAVLLARLLTARGSGRAQVRGAVLGAAAVLVVAALVVAPFLLDRPAEEPVAAAPAPVLPPAPEPSPLPPPAAPPSPPAAEPVAAAVRCAQQDLDFRVTGFDGAMGARAAAIEATNTGPAACWLEGVPVVVLLQGGRPLALQAGPGQTPEGAPATVQRIPVAPGGTALSLLTWRTYGGWADQETPQALTVALDPGRSLVGAALPAGSGPAPFDLADGGAWGIAPWAPPWS